MDLFSDTSKEKKWGKKLGIIFGVASRTFIVKNLFMMHKKKQWEGIHFSFNKCTFF
jgi:hypothetical protein